MTENKQVDVHQLLVECNPDRLALKAAVDRGVKELWTDFLRQLEEIFPHQPGDKSPNERLFRAYRSRVLTAGNSFLRELEKELGCYIINQVMQREIVSKVVIKGQGPWNLPPGVRMPGDDE